MCVVQWLSQQHCARGEEEKNLSSADHSFIKKTRKHKHSYFVKANMISQSGEHKRQEGKIGENILSLLLTSHIDNHSEDATTKQRRLWQNFTPGFTHMAWLGGKRQAKPETGSTRVLRLGSVCPSNTSERALVGEVHCA
jgi:hypothetical protein